MILNYKYSINIYEYTFIYSYTIYEYINYKYSMNAVVRFTKLCILRRKIFVEFY